MSSDAPPDLDVDVGDCRGLVWANKCAAALNTEQGLTGMRAFVRHFKRKGGEDGKPGDYEELLDKLSKASGEEEDEDEMEALQELLDGEDEEGWSKFSAYYNAWDEDVKIDFIETLNIIKCFPPALPGE